jgi:hypothetical protein
MNKFRKNKAQSTLEYAVVIALVIAALVYMGWGWFRGAYQKKIMSAADDISGGGQFDIDHTEITSTQTSSSSSTDTTTGTATGATFSTSQGQTGTSSYDATTDDLATRRGGGKEPVTVK